MITDDRAVTFYCVIVHYSTLPFAFKCYYTFVAIVSDY